MRDARRERWLALHGDGAIKRQSTDAEVQGRPSPLAAGGPRQKKSALSAMSRVTTPRQSSVVRIVSVSATTALVLSRQPLGPVGGCVELFLPHFDNRELAVTAGVRHIEELRHGYAVVLHFIVADLTQRRQLNELAELLAR